VLSVNAGLKDIPTLNMIFGVGLLAPWLVAFALSLLALRGEDKSIMLFLLFSMLSINLGSDYILSGEHQIMVTLCWPILFLLLRHSPLKWYDVIILWGLLVCFTRLYSTAIAPASLFILIASTRARSSQSLSEKTIFLSVILFSIVVIVVSAYAIISPRDPGNRTLFAVSMIKVIRTPEILMSTAFLILFFAGWYLNRNMLAWLAVIPPAIYVVYVISTGHTPTAVESFENRALSLHFLPLLMLGAVCIRWKNCTLDGNLAVIVVVFTFVIVGANLYSTNQWHEFRTQMKNELLSSNGLIPIEATDLLVSPVVWPWNNPLLSIVWSDDCVQSVILNADGLRWQPTGPPEYFWLTEYGCYTAEFSQFYSELCVCDKSGLN